MLKTAILTAVSMAFSCSAFAAVDGLYTSDCQVIDTASATISFDFSAKDLSLIQSQRVYIDKKCKTLGYDLIISGPYTLSKSGAFDYRLVTLTLTPLSALVASTFNSQKVCGLTGWANGKPQSVSGLNCSGQEIPTAGTLIYDIVKEVTGGIQTGKTTDTLDGSTAEKRPTAVETGVTYYSVK